MANPSIASSPQRFTFGTKDLYGVLTAYSGSAKRRSVDHDYPKRDAGDIEDMGRAKKRLAVRLVFIGSTCAKDYNDFKQYVLDNPKGLLIHPIAGRWQAYTDGPDEDVDFQRSFEEIQVRCEWREIATVRITPDVPDPGTAAQNVTAQLSKAQKTMAAFAVAAAKAEVFTAKALNALDTAGAAIDTATAPVDFVKSTIDTAVGAGSALIGKVLNVATKTNILITDVNNYVAAATDLFTGVDVLASVSTTTDTLLGAVAQSAADLEQALMDASPTPAGAADSVGDVEETLAACYELDAALAAARPPMVDYIVPELMDIITIAMRTGDATTALARASTILARNHIPNPAAISPGVTLKIPVA